MGRGTIEYDSIQEQASSKDHPGLASLKPYRVHSCHKELVILALPY